jgi:adenylate cyclase
MKFKKSLKKFLLYSFVAICIGTVVSLFNIYNPSFVKSFDNKLKDYMFIYRGPEKDSRSVVIIDIDEESLKALGQWPWPRDKIAQLLENLTYNKVGVIGFDIVFAELDQSSPHKVLNDLNIKAPNIPNYDKIFNSVVSNTPTVLGYQFELEDKDFIKKEELHIPALIIEKNKNDGQDMLINAKGTILNHQSLQESAYTSGFFNNIPDDNGVVRSVPLVIRYDDQIYPSLALEIIRISSGINKVFINYSELGVENIQIGDFKIPTDRHGRLVVNYRGPTKTFKYISALDIYNNTFDPRDIEGKITIIGTSAAGLNDLRAIPFESVYPGVEVHANAIDNILTGELLSRPNWVDGANFIIIFTIALLAILIVTFTPFWFNPIALFSLIGLISITSYQLLFEYGIIVNTLLPLITVILSILVVTFMDYMFEVKNEAIIKKKFASKVSPDVMESLLEISDSDVFSANSKEITVFFSDIRGFTNISESLPNAQTLIEFLNEYMNPMTDIIIKEKGTVDKFIGDAIMAYWNAPADVEDHPDKALNAALKQLHSIKTLNSKIKNDPRFTEVVEMSKRNNIPIIDIGIGINTGIAVVGEMGSTQRSDYTVIGDPINLGSRLESLCKYYDSTCNISAYTKTQLKEKYIFRELDLVIVKGKSEPVQIWQVIDYDKPNSINNLFNGTREELNKELEIYHQALNLYKNTSFQEALIIFNSLNNNKNKTNNNIYLIYIERCHYYIKYPPKDFNGVFTHTTKN